MASEIAHHGHAEPVHDEGHPSEGTYIRVAIILAIVTAVEVVIYYMSAARGILVPALLILSIAKFIAVVGFFMHLKFDSRLFRYMFAAGLVLTLSVYLALLAMEWTQHYFAPLPPM